MLENLINLLSAAALAGFIGLEREMHLQKSKSYSFGGFRTFAMLGALGYLSIYFEQQLNIPDMTILLFSAMLLFLAISHFGNVINENKIGLAAKLSALASFLIGILVANDDLYFAIAVCLLFTILLEFKELLHRTAKDFSQEEFLAILKFLIITGIILPILPDHTIDKWDIFNPKTIWLMVVLVVSIRFIGFFLSKIIGQKKGVIFSGAIGGLVSSTAVSSSLAEENKKVPNIVAPFLAGILLANGLMYLRVLLEAQIVYPELALTLAVPLLVMAVFALTIGIFASFQKNDKVEQKKEMLISQPFSLSEALKFGLFFLIILAAVKIVPDLLGNKGLFATAIISGLADTDAITLSVANLARQGQVPFLVAAQAITIAVMTNTLVKVAIVGIFGGRKLAYYTLASFTAILLAGATALFLIQ